MVLAVGGWPANHRGATGTRHAAEPADDHHGTGPDLQTRRNADRTSLRGIWDFHGDHPPQGDRPLQIGRRVPTVTVVIDTPDGISQAFPIIDTLTRDWPGHRRTCAAADSTTTHRGHGGLDLATTPGDPRDAARTKT